MRIFIAATMLLFSCSTLQKIEVPKPVFEVPQRVKGFVKIRDLNPFESLQGALYRHETSKLEVIVVPQLGTQVVAYVTTYKVGSRNEKLGQTGLAHLFEHMMFRGTPSFPEPFKTLSSWGDRSNASTNQDTTRYYELAPKEVFEDLVKFEAERMRHLTLTPQMYDLERGAVVSERKMRVEDNPMGRLIWDLNLNAYTVHPYKVWAIGFQKDLDAIPFSAALEFHKLYYAPNNAVISIVGDVGFDEALSMVDRYYGDYEPVTLPEESIPQEPEKGRKEKRIVIPQKTESVLYGEAVLGSTYADPTNTQDIMMCTLLGGGDYGHLNEELVRKEKIAAMAGASCEPGIDRALNIIFVKGVPGVSIAKLEAGLKKAVASFERFLTPQRLERIKMLYLSSQWSSLRNPLDLSQQLSQGMALTQNPLYDFDTLKNIQKVTLEEVKQRFDLYKKAPKTKVILNPSEKTKPLEDGVVSTFFEPKKGVQQ